MRRDVGAFKDVNVRALVEMEAEGVVESTRKAARRRENLGSH